jgi:hypothetical protein
MTERDQAVLDAAAIQGIAVLGNHLPRRCGIATFTTHLTQAVAGLFPARTVSCWR